MKMKSKETHFMVTIVSDSHINNEDVINEMARNIATAIVREVRENGIIPEHVDNATKIVYVKGWYNGKEAIEHV